MKLHNFAEIKNQSNDSADLFFYGDIVSDTWGKWQSEDKCPDDIISFLKSIDGVKNINIYVNSGGGNVFAGIAIYNILKRSSAFKTVYVDGVAASISSIIIFAGDKIIIPSNAYLMVHKPWSYAVGNSSDFRKAADDLDVIERGMMNAYESHLKDGVSIDEVQTLVDEETWLTGAEAANYFNIEVSEESKASASTSDYFKKYLKTPESISKQEIVSPPDEENEIEKLALLIQLL